MAKQQQQQTKSKKELELFKITNQNYPKNLVTSFRIISSGPLQGAR